MSKYNNNCKFKMIIYCANNFKTKPKRLNWERNSNDYDKGHFENNAKINVQSEPFSFQMENSDLI